MAVTMNLSSPEKTARISGTSIEASTPSGVTASDGVFVSAPDPDGSSGILPSRPAGRNALTETPATSTASLDTWDDGSPLPQFDELDLNDGFGLEMPPTDLDDLDSLQLETNGVSRQSDGSKIRGDTIWKSQTIWKFSVAAKLREAGWLDDAAKLEDCHSRKIMALCNGCQGVQVFRNRCDQFFCPECQPSLSRKRLESVKWWTSQITQPKHVVLTVRNIPDLTKAHVNEFKKWFTRLRHRKFCRGWVGGFYSLEITNEDNGWHLHLHCLVDARWIDARRLATEWAAVNGGCGHIVKVKDCRRKDYLAEVTKYAVKGSEIARWDRAKIVTFIEAFRGTKTFGVFGSLYGKRTEWREWIKSLRDGRTGCACGCDKVSYFDELAWEARSCVPTSQTVARPPPVDPQMEFLPVITARLRNFTL